MTRICSGFGLCLCAQLQQVGPQQACVVDLLETCSGEFVPVLVLLQRSRHAAHPEKDTLADLCFHFTSGDYVRYSKSSSGLEDPKGLVKRSSIIGGEIDDTVRDDHIRRVVRQRNMLDLALENEIRPIRD